MNSHLLKPPQNVFTGILNQWIMLEIFGLNLFWSGMGAERETGSVFLKNRLIKSGMAVVGVAKFLGCEKTLVKNPSEAVGPFLTSDRTHICNYYDFFLSFCLKKWRVCGLDQ